MIAEEITALQVRILNRKEDFRADWPVKQHILHVLNGVEGAMNIQEGDKATGLEILAGMQEAICFPFCPSDYGLQDSQCYRDGTSNCNDCRAKALNGKYEFRAGKWEEGK
jgi:hypothetical protein